MREVGDILRREVMSNAPHLVADRVLHGKVTMTYDYRSSMTFEENLNQAELHCNSFATRKNLALYIYIHIQMPRIIMKNQKFLVKSWFSLVV